MKNRIVQLDALRAIAIILVMFNHLDLTGLTSQYSQVVFGYLRQGGWIGVDLFFVLSGFLISGLLFNEFSKSGDINIKRFLIRRGFKIYPSYIVLIVVGTLIDYIESHEIDYKGLAVNLVFLQNYFPRLFKHTWTLSVEEHFYFLIPLLILFVMTRRREGELKWWFFTIASVCLALRIFKILSIEEFDFYALFARTHLRIDSLFFGVILNWCYRNYGLKIRMLIEQYKFAIVAFILAVSMLPFLYSRSTNLWIAGAPVSLLYIGFGLVLLLSMNYEPNQLTKFLARIGTYSYSIYLWHVLVNIYWARFCQQMVNGSLYWTLYFAGFFSISVLVGMLSHKVVEAPFLKLRNRYFP